MQIALIFISLIVLGIMLARISAKLLFNYFNKIDKIESDCNLTSFELLVYFIQTLNLNIKVAKFGHYLDNSYDIKNKIIVLSEEVFENRSVGALSVSMHELGHAVQHKNKSLLFYVNYALLILNKITSIILLPLIIFLIVSLFLPVTYFNIALTLLFVFYIINLLARIIIIPLEGNASKIAINLLKEYNIFNLKELKMAKKMLFYAKMTYVGGFFKVYSKIFRKILRGF